LADVSHSLRLVLSGHVQGVGFRPFVYRLAQRHGLTGQVQNRLGEVEILACGTPESLQQFEVDLLNDAPPLSRPTIDVVQAHEQTDFDAFEIVASSAQANARIFVPPDYFMCDDCRHFAMSVNRSTWIPRIDAFMRSQSRVLRVDRNCSLLIRNETL